MQLFVLKSCHTNEIEEGLQQPHNINIIPGGFEFVATTACITVDSSSSLCESVSQHAFTM